MYKVTAAYEQHKEYLEPLLVGTGIEGVERMALEVPQQVAPLVGYTLGKLVLYRFASDDYPSISKDQSVFTLAPMVEAVFETSDKYKSLTNTAYGVRIDYNRFQQPLETITAAGMTAITGQDKLQATTFKAALGQAGEDILEEYSDSAHLLVSGRFGSHDELQRESSHAVRLIEAAGITIQTHAEAIGMERVREAFTAYRAY